MRYNGTACFEFELENRQIIVFLYSPEHVRPRQLLELWEVFVCSHVAHVINLIFKTCSYKGHLTMS